jgi:hypothetical protein
LTRTIRYLLMLATLCAAFALATLMFPTEQADADYDYRDRTPRTGQGFGKPDSNNYVPEYRPYTVGTCYDGILVRTHFYTDYHASYGPYVMWIEYDRCEMRRMGATREDWREVIRHERAHARGFAHGEGSPRYNAAYHPSVSIG